MTGSNNSSLDDKALRLQIDRGAWLELSIQCSRTVASLEVVRTVLELTRHKGEAEQLKCFAAIKDVYIEAQLALTKFADLWSRLNEQLLKEGVQFSIEESEWLREAARQGPFSERRLVWADIKNRIVRTAH